MAKVLVAMSGGVDSSVAAYLLREEGHECVGVTLKLWGGASDSGCCSVSDVEDARRVAEQLGLKHVVFNFSEEFEEKVVSHYVHAYSEGRTPNPCIECNRSIKFAVLIDRARKLGFDYVATGHHARIVRRNDEVSLERGDDPEKDQSYVLSMLQEQQLRYVLLPVGEMHKSEVRRIAGEIGLRTASKPDSLEVCFISKAEGRETFLNQRVQLRPAKLRIGETTLGAPEGVTFETATIGQRRGLGTVGDSRRRFVVAKDPTNATLIMGTERDLLVREHELDALTWVHGPEKGDTDLLIQGAAHGATVLGRVAGDRVIFSEPRRRIAPGQTVAFYKGPRVVGSAVVRS